MCLGKTVIYLYTTIWSWKRMGTLPLWESFLHMTYFAAKVINDKELLNDKERFNDKELCLIDIHNKEIFCWPTFLKIISLLLLFHVSFTTQQDLFEMRYLVGSLGFYSSENLRLQASKGSFWNKLGLRQYIFASGPAKLYYTVRTSWSRGGQGGVSWVGPSCPSSSFLCLGGAAPLLVQATTLKVFLLNQCGTTSNFCQTSTRLPCTSTGRGLGGARWGPPDSGQTAREGGLWEWEGHLGKVKAAKVGLGGSAWEEPCHCRILTMGGSLNCFHLLSALKMLILTSFCDFLLYVLYVTTRQWDWIVFIPNSRNCTRRNVLELNVLWWKAI